MMGLFSLFVFMGNSREIFNFFIPATVVKASNKPDDRRWIQGIASTPDLDLQREKVIQSGIDYSYFLSNGYINDDHKDGPEHKVGEPTEAKITKDGFYFKGFLYKGKERADYWWEHLNALERSQANRKVGFSIQGKVQRRRGNKIEKCWIQDVAITASPVNTKTWAEIVKSLSLENWEKSLSCCDDHPNCKCDEKALSAGGMGGNLVPESLEGDSKVTTFKSIISIPDTAQMSYEDCVVAVQLDKGFSRPAAEAIVDAIFAKNNL